MTFHGGHSPASSPPAPAAASGVGLPANDETASASGASPERPFVAPAPLPSAAPSPSAERPSPAEPPSPSAEPPPPADHSADEAALAVATAELDAVEAALGRLEDGSFEHCEVCGAPIGQDRLKADPLLTRCPAHAEPT